MNRSDEDLPDLHAALTRAIGDEPTMRSLPSDDVTRGRRLVRRRRLAAVTVTAATVPALALGGWALSTNLVSGSGANSSQLQPAGSSEEASASPTDDSSTSAGSTSCTFASIGPDGAGGGQPGTATGSGAGIAARSGPAIDSLSGSQARVGSRTQNGAESGSITGRGTVSSSQAKPGSGLGSLTAGGQALSGSEACSLSATDAPMGTVTSDCATTTDPATTDPTTTDPATTDPASTDPSAGSAECMAFAGPPVDSPDVDRVTSVMQQHADPDGTHAGDYLSVGGSLADDQDHVLAIYVGMGWSDGDRSGAVDVSIEDQFQAGPGSQCQDQSLATGPDVTCESRTLADGTTVMVGRGQQDGAERISVRYDRPDGTVVIATSDAASDQWWTDGSGAAPLAAPPLTVDQLVDLVLDPGNHL